MTIIIFIVVTEEWYGGGQNIKVFNTRPEAEEYIDNVESDEYDLLIVEKEIQI